MRNQYVRLYEEKIKLINFFKLRYFYIFLPIATATFLFLFVNISYDHFQLHEILWNKTNNYEYVDTNDIEYFVKTKGCTIPGFEPFDKSVLEYYHSEKNIECYNSSNPPLIDSDQDKIWIVKRHLDNYNIQDINNLSCCYRSFYRPPTEVSTSDDRHLYSHDCITFVNSTKINHEFIKVTCYYNEKEIYKDFHCFVFNDKLKYKKLFKSTSKMNIVMLGIDAVSRLNFHRTMPKTLKVLEDLEAIEMKGYNKVGDNTFPNLMPVLTGLSSEEITATCYSHKNSTFDDCNFIWNNYSDAGYYTVFAEDSSSIGLFTYMKNGFSGTPTDFYWRTFEKLADKETGHNHQLNTNLCLGPRLTSEVLLSYLKKFVTSMSPYPHFGLFWETSLTHDFLNYPLLGDHLFANTIDSLSQEGFLDNTIFVLLSDHGLRWGSIRSTHQGRIEERLPFLFIVLPKIFREKFPYATYNMKKNTRRLTTHFDLHETLLHLLKIEQLTNENIQKQSSDLLNFNSRGISMFLPIDENRTCKSAAIDPHWCTCHRTRKIEVNDSIALNLATVVLEKINNLLKDYAQCAKLDLNKIIDFSVGEPSYEMKPSEVKHIVMDYMIVIETQPGEGLFEATVRNTPGGWNVTGTISRINLYGNQSSCMYDYQLKLYCYCDSFIPKLNFFN